MIRDMCREFAKEELTPYAGDWDRNHTFPSEAIKKLGSLGLTGVMVSPEYGGSGLSTTAYAVAIEEISVGCASCGLILSVTNSLFCGPIGWLVVSFSSSNYCYL